MNNYLLSSRLNDVYYIDDMFSDDFINKIIIMKKDCDRDITSFNMQATRYRFISEEVANIILTKLRCLTDFNFTKVMPSMRIIDYPLGGYIKPHTDGYQIDENKKQTTHTFIIYLNDCESGTDFLDKQCNVIASAASKKGNILVFKHDLLHSSQNYNDKRIILRGDLY